MAIQSARSFAFDLREALACYGEDEGERLITARDDAIRAEEREACLKDVDVYSDGATQHIAAKMIAAAIRARAALASAIQEPTDG